MPILVLAAQLCPPGIEVASVRHALEPQATLFASGNLKKNGPLKE